MGGLCSSVLRVSIRAPIHPKFEDFSVLGPAFDDCNASFGDHVELHLVGRGGENKIAAHLLFLLISAAIE